MKSNKIIFEISESQKKQLDKFLSKVKKKYGSYGIIKYVFVPTGIDTHIEVESSHKESIDLSEYEKW